MGTLRSRLVEIVVGQHAGGALSRKSGADVHVHSAQQRVVPRILLRKFVPGYFRYPGILFFKISECQNAIAKGDFK